MHAFLEVAVLDVHLHRPLGQRLPVAPEHLEHVVVSELRQVHVVHVRARVDPVDGERPLRAQRQVLGLAHAADLPGELHRQAAQPLGHAQGVRELALVVELESGHHLRGRDPVEILRTDGQLHLLEQPDRHRDPVERQPRADRQFRLRPAQQRLAVDLEPGGQPVVLARVLVERERRQAPVGQHHRRPARFRAERDHDLPALLRRRELPPAHPDRRRLRRLVVLVEHREPGPRRRRLRQELEPSLAHHRPAAAPVADQLHDPRPPLAGQRRDLERPPHPP